MRIITGFRQSVKRLKVTRIPVAGCWMFCLSLFVIPACQDSSAPRNDRQSNTNGGHITSHEHLFTQLNPEETGIRFANTITETAQLNILTYEFLYNGGGVAAGDINNDGLVDLYFSGSMVQNKLYLNEGNFRFRDITTSAGVGGGSGFKTGISMADVNRDGLLDIYVCKSLASASPEYRKNMLYINNGDLTFTDRAKEYGVDNASFTSQAYFFDMDTDGDLDLYLLNHPPVITEANNVKVKYNEAGVPEITKSSDLTYSSDRLFENQGNKFIDITDKAGILNEAFGHSVAVGDFNDDLRPDLYVCNDYVQPDYLYINNGDNTFTDQFASFFGHCSFSSMGSDYADINNDGCPDLLSLDMLPRDHYRQNMLSMVQNFDRFEKMTNLGLKAQFVSNALQLNNCNGTFSDIGFLADVAHTDWSWSALFADYDNDGWKDIYITNGYKRDLTNQDFSRYTLDSLKKVHLDENKDVMFWVESIPSTKLRSYLFRNNGNLQFADVSEAWNSGSPAFSNGAAYADLNNDGYLDLVVNNIDEPAFVFRNNGGVRTKNNFIRFSLADKNDDSAFGTRIRIHLPDQQFQDQVFYPVRGFYSSVEPIVHFGLGNADAVQSAEIIWPNGDMQILKDPKINTTHRIAKKGTLKYAPEKTERQLFENISSRLPQEASHKENVYIDFKREPLLHHKYSEEGPAAARGDINGDGLDDIYLGGARGLAGKLFLQQQAGMFQQARVPVFEQDSIYEDVAALFFDANGDNAPDLIVVSGGNEHPYNDAHYQDRLYLNNGTGDFTRAQNGLPEYFTSGGCVSANDVDGDGDLDLFVGGRVSPGRYPVPPQSYLFRNDGGKFSDATSAWSEGLSEIGMVTAVKFADLDNDNISELILAGEWMPVTICKMIKGKYQNSTGTFGLDAHTGWWYSLEIADFNHDGYADIVAGNLGLNSHIQASQDKPATLHYGDYDKNGTIDPLLCFYNRDTSFPLHLRDRLQDHLIYLKKKFTRYRTYADATLETILTPGQLSDSRILSATTFSHTLFLNQAGKGFTPVTLPLYTQFSVVRSMVVLDINDDGKKDLVLGGNHFGTDAQFGRYDASIGAVLLGDGNGGFSVVSAGESGLSIPGNVRAILPLSAGRDIHLLVLRNHDACSLFRLTE